MLACNNAYDLMKQFEQNQSCKTGCMNRRGACYQCCQMPKTSPSCGGTYCWR
jgi:hypothetical protein